MQERIKNSKMETIPNTAHMPQIEQPEALCSVIKNFVMMVEQTY